MKRTTIGVILGLVAGLLVAPAGAGAESPGWAGRFTITPEFLYWTHTPGDSPPINVIGPTDTLEPGERLYDFGDLDLTGWRPGGALTVAYRLDQVSAVWARGFYVGEFGREQSLCILPGCPKSGGSSSTFTIEPGNATTTNNTLGGFIAFTSNPSSSVWGLEANYDRTLLPGPGLLVRVFGGPRFIQFRDRIDSLFFEDANDLAGTDNEIQGVTIEVLNNLVGAQVGVDLRQPLIQTLFVDARASAGVFANIVERDRRFEEFETGSTFVLDDNRTGAHVAEAVEASLLLSWQFLPNWTASVGYQMLFLNDVSVAPSHFQTVAVPGDTSLRATSSVIFHGAVVRLGAQF